MDGRDDGTGRDTGGSDMTTIRQPSGGSADD
jgi:hypothetical protein